MKNALLIALVIFSGSRLLAQSGSGELEIPAERVYLHQNATLLLSGEYLYYKVYCINNSSGKVSDLSKVVYVQMIGRDGKPVFSHKVRLEKGTGQGDFFIPTSVASGNYQLVAFSNWMRNGKVEDFYHNELIVINPFQKDQKGLLSTSTDSTGAPSRAVRLENTSELSTDVGISVEMDPSEIGNRERGTIRIQDIPGKWHGSYSLSVKKIPDLKVPERKTAHSFDERGRGTPRTFSVKGDGSTHLPELRGELLKGRVLAKESGVPAENRKVALSIPGKNYIFKISSTGKDGRFSFNLDQPYANDEALIQLIGEDKDQFRIEMDPFDVPDFSRLSFSDFVLSEEMEEMILEHSIRNQVQNAYAGTRVDSIRKLEDYPPFFGSPTHEYYLDDYTRFPTIKETILEVVEQASTRQRKGEQYIHVRVYDDEVETGLNSLLLIDGLFIQDHNSVVEAKAFKIKKISVVNEQYLYGSEVFEGIISMESYEGDFLESLPQLDEEKTRLFRPELNKNYHKQDYRYKERYRRIPDFRTQLVWEPDFRLEGTSKSYYFYTSDLDGMYEISIEGFSDDGKPLSLRKVFRVN